MSAPSGNSQSSSGSPQPSVLGKQLQAARAADRVTANRNQWIAVKAVIDGVYAHLDHLPCVDENCPFTMSPAPQSAENPDRHFLYDADKAVLAQHPAMSMGVWLPDFDWVCTQIAKATGLHVEWDAGRQLFTLTDTTPVNSAPNAKSQLPAPGPRGRSDNVLVAPAVQLVSGAQTPDAAADAAAVVAEPTGSG